jgi:hypothetical protein
MPTLTKTRAMSHANSLAALNATAKKAATKEAEMKKQDAIDKKKEEEEQAFKIKEASEEKKRDAARLKAGKAARTTQAIEKEAKKKEHATNKVNVHLMELSNFDGDENEEEKDGASKILFDKEADSPVQKRHKRSIGALKPNLRYTKPTMASKKYVTLQQHTTFIDFGVMLTTNDKSGEFSIKVKELLMNLQLLDKTAGLVELSPRNKN